MAASPREWGVKLELPHQDLPRAGTALSSCLCLGRGSPLTPGIVPSALTPCDRAGAHKCFGFCSVHMQAAPAPHSECTAGSALCCPQRCCSWAGVLLAGGLCPAHPAPAASVSSSLPPGQVCLPCLYILPASWGLGGCQPQSCPSECQGGWLPIVLASAPCSTLAGSHLCSFPPLLPTVCAPHSFPCPPLLHST